MQDVYLNSRGAGNPRSTRGPDHPSTPWLPRLTRRLGDGLDAGRTDDLTIPAVTRVLATEGAESRVVTDKPDPFDARCLTDNGVEHEREVLDLTEESCVLELHILWNVVVGDAAVPFT